MKKNYIKPEIVTREIALEPILALSMYEGEGDGGGPRARIRETRTPVNLNIFDEE